MRVLLREVRHRLECGTTCAFDAKGFAEMQQGHKETESEKSVRVRLDNAGIDTKDSGGGAHKNPDL